VKKLTKVQAGVVRRMRAGWSLGWRPDRSSRLYGRPISRKTLDALIALSLVEHDPAIGYSGNTLWYRLTDLGKTCEL
jgi:hypothetical protein